MQNKSINQLNSEIIIGNNRGSNDYLLQKLSPLTDEPVWKPDYVEITFRGQTMKFNSWSGKNLTAYDTEYKPWKVSFNKENIGYLLHYDLNQGDVVVDAGGYVGTFAIYAAKVVGEKGKVIVFEPDTENFRKLQENIVLNGLSNVIIINKALWNKDTNLKFNNKHTAGASFFFNASPFTREVQVVSLDNELARLGIAKVNFIKMDVEGSEIHVLEGAVNTLAKQNVHLAIATYHIIDGEETSSAIENILHGFGYDAITEFTKHKTTYGSRGGFND
jgi:FkbM family methyltransferase